MSTSSRRQLTTAEQQKRAVWLSEWKTRSDIEKRFSPIKWGYALANPDRAYLADCPTLQDYNEIYGEDASFELVRLHIVTLYSTSNCKDKGIADGIKLFAQAFANDIKTFKLSEILLFFARYRAGRYDNSFASFDAKRIGNAFHFEFLKERSIELSKLYREQSQQEIEKRRFVPPKGYTSISWYEELKKRASQGDIEAINMLNPQNYK